MRYYMACDPDLRTPAIAVLDADTNKIVAAGLLRIDSSLDERGAVIQMASLAPQWWKNMAALIDQHLAIDYVKAIAVEGQEATYTAKSGKNPRSLLALANASGCILSAGITSIILGSTRTTPCEAYYPRPAEWKGQVPKEVHQARVLKHLGYEYTIVGGKSTGYAYPTNWDDGSIKFLGKVNRGDWKEIMDAVGLCLWMKDNDDKRARMNKYKTIQVKG